MSIMTPLLQRSLQIHSSPRRHLHETVIVKPVGRLLRVLTILCNCIVSVENEVHYNANVLAKNVWCIPAKIYGLRSCVWLSQRNERPRTFMVLIKPTVACSYTERNEYRGEVFERVKKWWTKRKTLTRPRFDKTFAAQLKWYFRSRL